MAQELTGVTLTAPASDPNIDESQTLTMSCTYTQAGHGGEESVDLHWRFSSTSGSGYTDILTTGDLTTPTNPTTGSDSGVTHSVTIAGVNAGTYYLNVRAVGQTSAADFNNGNQVVTVNAAAAQYTITGAQTVTTSPAATLDYTRNASITGDQTVTATVAASLAYNRHYSIAGAQTVAATPASGMTYAVGGSNYTITGAQTVAIGVSAALEYSRHYVLSGGVSVAASPAATLDYTRNAAIVGAVTVAASIGAATAYNQHPAIAGAVSVGASPSASMAYNQHPSITGAVQVATSVAGVTEYSSGNSIVGAVTVTASPAAGLAYNQHPAITGDVSVSATPVAAMLKNQHPIVVGSVLVSSAAAASMAYAGGSVSSLQDIGLPPLLVTLSADIQVQNYSVIQHRDINVSLQAKRYSTLKIQRISTRLRVQ